MNVDPGQFDDVSVAEVELVARRRRNERIQLRILDVSSAVQGPDIDQVSFSLIEVGDRQEAAAEDKRIRAAQAGQLIAAVAATAIENVCIVVARDVIAEVRADYILEIGQRVRSSLDGILRLGSLRLTVTPPGARE